MSQTNTTEDLLSYRGLLKQFDDASSTFRKNPTEENKRDLSDAAQNFLDSRLNTNDFPKIGDDAVQDAIEVSSVLSELTSQPQ